MSNVPIVTPNCHKIKNNGSQGEEVSHAGYPDSPYQIGHQCRLIIQVPKDERPVVNIGEGEAGLRPWDYAVMINGHYADKLNFICDVNQYTSLGERKCPF